VEKVAFWIMSPLSLGSAIAMILARNAVHSALLLVVNFFTLAVFYVLLDAHFLAAVQVIVYAGAIMVLFLFVIMLLGVDREEDLVENVRFQRPLALVFGVGLAGIIVWTVRTALAQTTFRGLETANASGNVQAVGRSLFSRYLLAFEVTSVLLLVAAIGAIVLGRRDGGQDEGEPEVGAPREVAP
jgi:NADH-quinone oxidoreductase subunit J